MFAMFEIFKIFKAWLESGKDEVLKEAAVHFKVLERFVEAKNRPFASDVVLMRQRCDFIAGVYDNVPLGDLVDALCIDDTKEHTTAAAGRCFDQM